MPCYKLDNDAASSLCQSVVVLSTEDNGLKWYFGEGPFLLKELVFFSIKLRNVIFE